MSPDEAIARVATKQYGAFRHEHGHRAGFTDSAIERRRASGRWLTPHRGVYVLAGVPLTREQEIIIVVFAFGVLAAASHAEAAFLLTISAPTSGAVNVVLPHAQHRRTRRGVVIHQAQLVRSDVRRVRGIPATCPNRTLVDLASVLQPERLEACVDEAILNGLTTADRALRYMVERELRCRPGAGVLFEVLRDRKAGAPQKELERMFVRKIRRSKLPMPVRQQREGKRKIDFAYPRERIAIELDGRNPHSSGAVFRDDRRRQNELVLAGWHPIRFTWVDVDEEWDAVEATLAGLLSQRARPE